jgi:HEAT repeat protein
MAANGKRFVYDAWQRRDVNALITALTDPESRTWAASYLGKLGDPAAIPALMRLLGARDFQARAAAARALAKLGATEAVPALLDSVERGPEDVMRAWAIDSLGKIGSREAVRKLIDVLGSSDERLRWTAAVALGAIGDKQAIPALEAAATRERFFVRRRYRRVIRQLANAQAS